LAIYSSGEQGWFSSGVVENRPSGPAVLSISVAIRIARPLAAFSYPVSVAMGVPGVRFVVSSGVIVGLGESKGWLATVWAKRSSEALSANEVLSTNRVSEAVMLLVRTGSLAGIEIGWGGEFTVPVGWTGEFSTVLMVLSLDIVRGIGESSYFVKGNMGRGFFWNNSPGGSRPLFP
jgi:hypothetical protein